MSLETMRWPAGTPAWIRGATVTILLNGQKSQLNWENLATLDTAQALAATYGAVVITQEPLSGPMVESDPTYLLKFPGGGMLNAGRLALQFTYLPWNQGLAWIAEAGGYQAETYASSTQTVPSGSAPTGNGIAVVPPSSDVAPALMVVSVTTRDQVLQTAGPAPKTVDQWNYFYHRTAEGILHPAPAYDLPGIAPGEIVSFDRWWTALNAPASSAAAVVPASSAAAVVPAGSAAAVVPAGSGAAAVPVSSGGGLGWIAAFPGGGWGLLIVAGIVLLLIRGR